MKFSEFLLENRVDDFRNKFGRKFPKEQLERIVDTIPQKYLLWVGKNFEPMNFETNLPLLVQALTKFDKLSSNLPQTDINEYLSLGQLIETLNNYENRTRRQYRKVEGGNVVYDDNRFFVVNPLTHQASCYYGKGTKWCTAADSDYQFKQYNDDSKLFYILDKTKPADDPYYKIALLRKFNGDKTFFDAQDKSMKSIDIIVEPELLKQIMISIDDYLNTEFEAQMKIYADKELARKERERIERLRIQRVLEGKREEAQERRNDDEWNLENGDEIGLKAYALLEWLSDNGDVEVLTNDDRLELQRLRDEKERLENEYENDEDVRRDLLDRIEEIDDEIDEYQNKIDVYNIVPNGQFYDCTQFEVIDAGLAGNTYAVGTDGEMQSSAEEYVSQLIDDIGYEGFNKSFVENHIDTEDVVYEARNIYEDDVYENPEAYLDESDRLLSREQENQVKLLKMKIERDRMIIQNLEEHYEQSEDESIQEKIDDLEDLITEYENEIEEIQEDPEGEYPQDLIDEKVDELVEDVRRDPKWFLDEHGLEVNNYIDRDAFIEAVIDEDGYGHTLNSYDGNADEVRVANTTYYVMRID